MANKKTSLRESLLSYFESRKDGKSPDLTPKKKIKPQAPKRIPNQITSLPVDEGKRPDSGLPDIKKSIDSLVNALGKMTSSSNTTNNNKTINNNRNTFNNRTDVNNSHKNSSTNTSNSSNTNSSIRTSNNNSSMNSLTTNDIFNSVRKSFMEQNINKSSGKMKNPKLIVSKTIPFIKNSLVNNSEETTNENNVITKDITNKIEKISKEITPKVIKLNKRKNDYKTTHASKKIPRVIELTKMNEKTQNVFKNLSNKMYTVVPSKTSSKILSSLIKYESNNTMQRNFDKSETFNSMMNIRNLIGKEKYNVMQVPALQEGGIVSKPTLAMVGEGGRPEEIRPINKNNPTPNQLEIQKSQNPSATSVGVDSMNKNAALKVEKENDPTSGGSDAGNQNMIVNSPTIPAQDAPARTNPSFEHGATKSSKALSTQTHYPRWRRTMG